MNNGKLNSAIIINASIENVWHAKTILLTTQFTF